MGWRQFLQAGLLLVFAGASPFAYGAPKRLEARLTLDRQTVRARFSVLSVFGKAFRRRLTNGLTSRVVLAIELLDPNGETVVVRQRRCDLRFEVWDEQVYVRIQDEEKVGRYIYPRIERSLGVCAEVDVPLIPIRRLIAAGGYRLRVRVALNPVSPELIERSRQFTSNPRGTASARPQAFFGAVASLFRSESDAGGTVFVFQSERLVRPSSEAPAP